jgi:competence protein ComEC
MMHLALGFAFGAWWLQQQAYLPTLGTCLVLLLFLISCMLLLKRYGFQTPRTIFTLISQFLCLSIAVIIGFTWAAVLAQSRLNDALPQAWERKSITLVGLVSSLPETNEQGTRFKLDVEKVLTPNAERHVVPNHLMLSAYKPKKHGKKLQNQADLSAVFPQFKVGERWRLTVRLKRPHTTYNPHGFDYEYWAFSENIRATGTLQLKSGVVRLSPFVWRPSTVVNLARENIAKRIELALPNAAYAGIVKALVVGDDSQVNQSQWQTLLTTGTNHLMSISGLHITMLAGLGYWLFAQCWRRFSILVNAFPTQKAASLAGLFVAILYAALAGFSIPTQRTLYMLATVVFMLLLNRKLLFTHVLSTALFVVVLLDPWSVSSAGFWLSFGAVAFIVFATSHRLRSPSWMLIALRTQWAVTLGLMPLLVLMFGQFSIISPIANAFAIPLVSYAVVPPAILGSLLPMNWLIQFSHAMLEWVMYGLNAIATWPMAVWQQPEPATWAVCLGIMGIAWHLLPNGVPFRIWALFCLLPLFNASPTIVQPKHFNVTVLDVGQGQAVLVQTAKHALLYDTGPIYSEESNAGARIVLPFLRGEGVKKLDMLVLSHDDNDHVGGATAIFDSLPVINLLSSLNLQAQTFSQKPYLQHKPRFQQRCQSGQHWQWDGVSFEVLSPNQTVYEEGKTKDNNKSCVIKVSQQTSTLLLTGDIEKSAEYALLNQYSNQLKSTVMLAPHHGSKTSSTADFINAVNPKLAIVTNGYLNRFGHPKPAVMARYQQQQIKLMRSDYNGAIQLNFNQSALTSVVSWRNAHKKYWHEDYNSN